jgi:light-regulated signal transduction histidine kinase (bacteriophytochrome)
MILKDFYKESTTLEEQNLLFSKIEIVIIRLNDTLNELIQSVKIQGDKNITHDAIHFKSIFDETLEILDNQILGLNAIVTSDFSEAPIIEYPKIYMESIMLNLLSNSIKYSSPERAAVIHFCTTVNNNEITLMAKDNGLGIDLQKHGHKLFGLNNTFHEHPDSNGVGLFMIKTQIEAIGGSITVESEIDEGSTFKIIFKRNISC